MHDLPRYLLWQLPGWGLAAAALVGLLTRPKGEPPPRTAHRHVAAALPGVLAGPPGARSESWSGSSVQPGGYFTTTFFTTFCCWPASV